MRFPFIMFGLLIVLLLAPATRAQLGGVPSDSPGQAQEPKQRPLRIRVGGNVAEQGLVHKVLPEYPASAKAAHITGTVLLHVIISKDGTMQHIEYVSGPPELMKAAIDAVAQWTYKPVKLNGEPLEVDTTIQVVFQLNGSGDTNQAEAAIDPQLKGDILRMIEVSHFRDRVPEITKALFDSMAPIIRQSLPPTQSREMIMDAYREKFAKMLMGDELIDEIAATYAKYLTDDDVKGIIQFYETPVGQHYLAITPKMAGDLMTIGQHLAAKHMPEIFRQLCKEYPELQGAAKVCPEGPSEKKSLLRGPRPPSDLADFPTRSGS